jgi:hypothetical protein
MVAGIQQRNVIFNESDLVFCESFDERLHQDNRAKAPVKSAIKPYHVQRDLELEFELELELEERLNNDLAQERYYIQASKVKITEVFDKIKVKLLRKISL